MKLNKLCLSVASALAIGSIAGIANAAPLHDADAITNLEIINDGFPKVVSFRYENTLMDEELWEDSKEFIASLNGVIIKTFPWGYSDAFIEKASLLLDDYYAQQYPRKFNSVQTIPQLLEYGDWAAGKLPHAGAFIYLDAAKARIATSFSAEDTVITLDTDDEELIKAFDPSVFKFDDNPIFLPTQTAQERPVILVRKSGKNINWDEAEFASVQSFDPVAKTLTIRRNVLGDQGEALDFDKDSDGAMLVISTASKERGYLPNFTTLAQNIVGSNFNIATEVANAFTAPFQAGGSMQYRHGMALDVGWEKPKANGVGINNEYSKGLYDKNYTNDLDYTKGFYEYLYQQRQQFGPTVLLSSDSNHGAQRAVELLNGIELEGFTGTSDIDLLNWSHPFNITTYFKEGRRQLFDNAYMVMKDGKRREGDKLPLSARRSMLAGGAALGLIATHGLGYTAADFPDYTCTTKKKCKSKTFNQLPINKVEKQRGIIQDEMVGGTMNSLNWLGLPRGPLMRLGLNAPDLLNGVGEVGYDYAANVVAGSHTAVTGNVDAGTIVISHDGNDPVVDFAGANEDVVPNNHLNFTINFPAGSVDTAQGDLMVRLNIDADQRYGYDAKFGDIPRNLDCSIVNSSANSKKTQIESTAFIGGVKDKEVIFYWRNALAAGTNPQLDCKVDGLTDVRISKVTAHNAADVIMREFENGLVIANPALQGTTFTSDELAELFPGREFARLTANYDVQDNATVNNGAPVDSNNPVVLGAKDAIFLKTVDSNSVDTDNDGLPDFWEEKYAGLAMEPYGDTDNDGYNNLFEMRYQTDPTNYWRKPVLSFTTTPEGETVVVFRAKEGRQYRAYIVNDATHTSRPVGSYFEGFGKDLSIHVPAELIGPSERVSVVVADILPN